VQFSFWSGQKNDFSKSIDMTSGTHAYPQTDCTCGIIMRGLTAEYFA
jgi:hypothetical protein